MPAAPSGTGLLVLSVTAACNLRCRYCYARGGEGELHMSWPEAARAVDLMSGCFSSFKIQFTGGEPLLNLGLIEQVMGYLAEKSLKAQCQIQTNAALIDAEKARRIKELGLGVGVSIDGPVPINDLLRPFSNGSGSTGSTIKGVMALRDRGIRVGATCVLSKGNAATLPGLVDLLSYLGNVEGLTVDTLRPVGRGNAQMQADPAQAAAGLEAAIVRSDHLASSGGKRVAFRELDRMLYALRNDAERKHHCFFDSGRSLLVMPGGDAYACPSLVRQEFRLGNVLEPSFEKGLKERMATARSVIGAPAACLVCQDRCLCGGACLAPAPRSPESMAVECAIKKTFMRHARIRFLAE